ncbi:MAG: hypothetical protein ABI624_02025 [Casimicrobiaceae bacterium]
MSDITNIRYRDIAEGEKTEHDRLEARLTQLGNIAGRRGGLTPDELAEQVRVKAVLAAQKAEGTELCGRLFVGVRDLFNASPGLLGGYLHNHVDGVLKGQQPDLDDLSQEASCKAALTIGLLLIDEVAATLPLVVTREAAALQTKLSVAKAKAHRGQKLYAIVADTSGSPWAGLSKTFFAAIGEAQSMSDLAMLVLPLLAIEGDPRGRSTRSPGTVYAQEFARVMRQLTDAGVTHEEPQLRRRMNEVLNVIQNRGADGSSVELGIDLPDLEDAATSSIVPDNVRLMGPMICAAMFDELKAFEVVDKLVELFQQGMLTIGNGTAGKQLYKYWKDAPNRMSDAERRNFYAMTMGVPGGETSGMVNREFNDLWLRFVSSVSSFVRQSEVDKLLRASLPSPISHQQIRKAARDLAVNLSLHGYGMAYYAALDLQAQIKFMIGLLGDKEIMANYGARDMWQVVDQVATLELGGAKTSSRYRTLATCGAIITAWLADNAAKISSAAGPIIDIDEVRQPKPRIDGSKATSKPTDADLVNACELWLADTATGDSVIDQMAQPRETPVMTSRPVQIPAIAREMLADLPGMGMSVRH